MKRLDYRSQGLLVDCTPVYNDIRLIASQHRHAERQTDGHKQTDRQQQEQWEETAICVLQIKVYFLFVHIPRPNYN